MQEFHAAVAQPDMALAIFFCSSMYDLELLARKMKRLFAGVQVVGCTTAGEIGPAGYQDNSLTGVSFPASNFAAVSGHLDHLQQFEADRGQTFTQELLQKLENQAPHAQSDNSFGLLLIDGLSMREEPVTRALQSALGKCPLAGGSAGDGVNFGRTLVYSEGSFHADSAVLTLVTTPLPFRLFKTQHFVATDERLVVTEPDATHRIVKEINGWPAATEYARILGVDADHLGPASFAASPVVVLIDSTNYVRSVQAVNPDGSLTFFCAIEEGLVLRVAKGVDLLANLEQAFTRIREEIGAPQLVLTCECLLRKLEIFQSPSKDPIDAAYRQTNTVGFHIYVQGTDYTLLQSAVVLEEQVHRRTKELEAALHENGKITQALRESELKFHGLVNQSLVGIVIIEDGKFRYANAKFNEIFGYSAEEVRGMAVLDTAIEQDRPMVAQNIRKRLSGEVATVSYVFHGLRRDGVVIDVEVYSCTSQRMMH